MKSFSVFILLFIAVATGCNESKTDKTNVAISDSIIVKEKVIPLDLQVIRIEQEMWASNSRKGIAKLLDKYPEFAKKFLKRAEYPDDSILVNAFYQLSQNKTIDSIYKICNKEYGDFYDQGLQFQQAFQLLAKQDRKFVFPKIYTIITGMGNDMLVNDSMIVVGLEFFLAEKSRYKPQLPLYMLKRYRKEYIVPMALAFMSGKYNATDYLDNSLLAEMVFYGKSYYFLEKLLPDISDTLIAGYDKAVLADVEKNQKLIWAHFIDKKLLFETKNEITNRYVGERPTTFEIGNNCPGRIGRWLGWQIVRAYAERNPKLSLMDIMKEKDARKILNQSRYKPKR